MTNLESIHIIKKSISAVIKGKTVLAKALALPLAINITLILFGQLDQDAISSKIYLLSQLFFFLLAFTIGIIAYVSIHRAIIIEEGAANILESLSFGNREWRYAAAYIKIIVCCLPCLVFILIPHIGVYIVAIVAAYIFTRISLMLPSVAIDKPMDVRASWESTKDKQFTIFTVLILLFTVFFALEWLMLKLAVPTVLIEIALLFTTLFYCVALSEVYKIVAVQVENETL